MTTDPIPSLSASEAQPSKYHTNGVNHAQTGFGTRAVHAGQDPDPVTGAVIPPISLSTTFKQHGAGEYNSFDYSRSGNPTRNAFETAVASLENGKHAVAFASGSAATATIVNSLAQGAHIVSINDVYGGTFRYFTKVASQFGVQTTFVDLADPNNLTSVLRDNTRLVWIETPTNPTLKITSISAIAEIAHRHDILLVVDNTFMSPYNQNPLDLGADIAVHSATKYINGHSDVVMGVAVTNDNAIATKLRFLQNSLGAVPSAFDCFLANRGLKTLHLRMRQHEKSAIALANYLEHSPYVESVIYPGLASHPQHEIARQQQRGFGGMISFRVNGGLENAQLFLKNLKIFVLAESLGGVESLCELPAVMTHMSVDKEIREKLGITDNLVRLSVGIEDAEDLIADVEQALAKSDIL